jgi:hypothetical protein
MSGSQKYTKATGKTQKKQEFRHFHGFHNFRVVCFLSEASYTSPKRGSPLSPTRTSHQNVNKVSAAPSTQKSVKLSDWFPLNHALFTQTSDGLFSAFFLRFPRQHHPQTCPQFAQSN